MKPDHELLREYAEGGSEAAFALLVERYGGLVYSAALRQTHERGVAEEITQGVFLLLARKAGSLGGRVIVAGWLLRTTRFMAKRTRTSQERRRERERQAMQLNEGAAHDETWKDLAPLLDEGLDRLSEKDRSLLMLRFLRGLETAEVCAALGMKKEAVKKRQARALEKLRVFFARRGFRTTVQGLTALLGGHMTEATFGAGFSLAAARASKGSATLARETERLLLWNRFVQGFGAAAAAGVAAFILTFSFDAARADAARGEAAAAREPAVERIVPGMVFASGAFDESGRGIWVTVLDEESGAPLEGVEMRPLFWGRYEMEDGLPVETGAEGRAWVAIPETAPGRIDIGLLKEGWQQRSLVWTPGRGDEVPSEHTARLSRGVSIGGWVRDEGGTAIRGAEIELQFRGSGDSSERMPRVERPGFVGDWVVARTDTNGYWSTAVVPRDLHGFSVQVSHREFTSTNAVVSDALFEGKSITIPREGFTLRGLIVDEEGGTVAGATIIGANGAVRGESGESGGFVLKHLSGGELELAVTAKGFGPHFESVKIPMEEALRLVLQRGASMKARVMDENGEGVAGAGVMLETKGGTGYEWQAVADSSGRVSWAEAPAGLASFYVFAGGYYEARNRVIRSDGQEHEIILRPVIVLGGTVLEDESGSPIEEFRAVPGHGDDLARWTYGSAARGVDGTFKLDVQRGKMWVRIEAEGFAPAEIGPVTVPPGGTNLMVRLKKENPDYIVRGQVLRADGRPAAGAEVALGTVDDRMALGRGQFVREATPLRVFADENGEFVFGSQRYAHTVAATHPTGFAKGRVREGERVVRLQVEPWARIEGMVSADAPKSGFVQIQSRLVHYAGAVAFDIPAARVPVDADGSFVFERVPPGRFALMHSGAGDGYIEKRVEISAGETAWVDLGAKEGVIVTGRYVLEGGLAGRLTGQGVLFRSVPHPAPPEGLSPREAKLWVVEYWSSAEALKQLDEAQTRGVQLESDGRFRILNVRPGEYQLAPNLALLSGPEVIHLRAPGHGKVVVPEGEDGAVFDLGDVRVERVN